MAVPNLQFGTGDWEISGFLYLNSQLNNYGTLFGNTTATFSQGCVFLMAFGASAPTANDGRVVRSKLGVGGWSAVTGGAGFEAAGNPLILTSFDLQLKTRYFIRVNKVGSTMRMFVDESLIGSATTNAAWNFNTMGTNTWDAASSHLDGVLWDWKVKTSGISITAGTIPSTYNPSTIGIEDYYTQDQMQEFVFGGGKPFISYYANGSKTIGWVVTSLIRRKLPVLLVRGMPPASPLPLPQSPFSSRFYADSKKRYFLDGLYGVYGGATISGKVTIENIPGSRKVRLFDRANAMLIREMWSATDGRYSFKHLDPNREYFVLAHDHLRVHNAVIQDMIDPP